MEIFHEYTLSLCLYMNTFSMNHFCFFCKLVLSCSKEMVLYAFAGEADWCDTLAVAIEQLCSDEKSILGFLFGTNLFLKIFILSLDGAD